MVSKEKPFDRELFFRALADSTRLRIINLIGDQEVCVCFFVEILKTNLRLPAWLSNWVQARNLSVFSSLQSCFSTLTTLTYEGIWRHCDRSTLSTEDPWR